MHRAQAKSYKIKVEISPKLEPIDNITSLVIIFIRGANISIVLMSQKIFSQFESNSCR